MQGDKHESIKRCMTAQEAALSGVVRDGQTLAIGGFGLDGVIS